MFVNLGEFQAARRANQWPIDISDLIIWLKDFICQPNQNLGRSGAICPCAIAAVAEKRVLLSHIDLDFDEAIDKREYATHALLEMSWEFKQTTSQEEGSLDCLLVTLGGLARHELRYVVDGTYRDIKVKILERKMLVGGFHLFNNRSSRRNSDFFPMRTPIPVFAFRHMSRPDWRSLEESETYLEIYRKFYGEIPSNIS